MTNNFTQEEVNELLEYLKDPIKRLALFEKADQELEHLLTVEEIEEKKITMSETVKKRLIELRNKIFNDK